MTLAGIVFLLTLPNHILYIFISPYIYHVSQLTLPYLIQYR